MINKNIILRMIALSVVVTACGSPNVPPVHDSNQPIVHAKKSWLPARIPLTIDNSVFFALNSDKVAKTYESIVQYNLDYLVANPKSRILLNGYTNEATDSLANSKLGYARINKIKHLLISGGVKSEQIDSKLSFEAHPDNQKNIITKNQRVDFIYINDAPKTYNYNNKPTIEMP